MAKDYYDLEYELVGDSKTALEEEQATAKEIYKGFADKIENIKKEIPNPEVGITRAESLISYDQYDSLPYYRSQNQRKWDKIEKYEAFYDNEKMYFGHMLTDSDNIFWVYDDSLKTTFLETDGKSYHLINANDKDYKTVFVRWLDAGSDESIQLARDIVMEDKKVVYVNDKLGYIGDPFLKRALRNNKASGNIVSIIRTIQDNQNRIRTDNDKSSFIVQGCAGSGKTVVMLHRIQYLKYNGDIHEGEYCIIGPTPEYRDFYEGYSNTDFNIRRGTIIPFGEFYRFMAGKEKKTENIQIVDESVFSDEFLKRIYSGEFMAEALRHMYKKIFVQLDRLINHCRENCRTYEYCYSVRLLKSILESAVEKPFNKKNNVDVLWERIQNLKERITECIGENGLVESTQSLSIFSQKTLQQFKSKLNTLLMNSCKKQINDEFGIKVSKAYKYYWYLYLQCTVLTKGIGGVPKKYEAIFIDEAQHLSPMELKLIDDVTGTMLNVFGDVNQCIYKHGMNSWKNTHIHERYKLNENFRNTNQIIRYCNNELGMNVSDVGIDGDEVTEYESAEDLYSETLHGEAVCIVKDEFARKDLKEVLGDKVADIRTVSEVNGLEFKYAYVFTRDMEKNEKYIAFTRPLLKLSVIKNLPNIFEQIPEIIQDDDETVDEEDA